MSAGSPQGRMVLVVDPDLGFADALSVFLDGDRVIAARSMAEGAAIAEGGRLDLAILGPSFGSEEGVASAAALRDADPGLLTVLVADVPTNRMLRMAIRSGLTDVIDAPITARKLSEVLGRTDAIDNARSIPVVFETPTAATPQHRHVAPDAPEAPVAESLPAPELLAPPSLPDEAVTVSHASSSDTSFEDAFDAAFGEPLPPTEQPTAPATAPPLGGVPAPLEPELPPVPEVSSLPLEEPMAVEQAPGMPPPAEEVPAVLDPVSALAEETSVAQAAPPVPEEDLAFAPPMLPSEELAPAVAPTPPAMSPEEHFAQLATSRPGAEPVETEPVLLPVEMPPLPPSSPPTAADDPAAAPVLEEPVVDPSSMAVSGSPADLAGLGADKTPDPSPVPLARRRPGGGRVITVMAGKGGSGKTITATNLAAALTERLGEDQVVIVDADLQFGDVALMMQVDPTRTIVEAAAELEYMTEHRLDALLLRHDSGLRVLPAPLVPASVDKVNAKDVVRIVEILRGMYQYVIVDTAPIFDDGLIMMLEHSDDVLVVVDMDLPSVKNAKIALDTLRAVGFDIGRIKLVVNRANSKARLDLAELERALGEKVSASIPSDRLIPQSVNEGVPAVAFSPRSRVAKAFHALADLFLPA